jgi:hypothetical protein
MGAVTVLKEIGILVSSLAVLDWLSASPDPDRELGEGWIADINRQLYADEYQQTYDKHAPHLSGSALAKLNAHTVLAKKAVMEPTATVYNGQADAMADGLEAAADKLMAQQLGVTPSGSGAQVQLLPAVEMVGQGFDITVGGDAPTSMAKGAFWPTLLVLGAVGAGALYLAGK